MICFSPVFLLASLPFSKSVSATCQCDIFRIHFCCIFILFICLTCQCFGWHSGYNMNSLFQLTPSTFISCSLCLSHIVFHFFKVTCSFLPLARLCMLLPVTPTPCLPLSCLFFESQLKSHSLGDTFIYLSIKIRSPY